MSVFGADCFSWGTSGRYRLLIPARNQRVARPRAEPAGTWIHVPYGRSTYVTDTSHLHTVWTPQGGILIPDDEAYAGFEEFYDRFAQLQTPWHAHILARLASLDVVPFDDGSFRGGARWEWWI